MRSAVMNTIKYVVMMMMASTFTLVFTEYRGNVCLQKAATFIYPTCTCFFRAQFPNNFLKVDDIPCRTKCNVTINGFKNGFNKDRYVYSIEQFNFTLGGFSSLTSCCQYYSLTTWPLHVNINCSSWSQDEYMIWGREKNNCQERNAYCIRLNQICICQCWPGYLMVDGHCLKDNVYVGEPCVDNAQCRGTTMSGVCENWTCTCAKGYISEGQHCYEESSLGSTLGALFGGVLLGVLITTVIGFIIYKRIRKNPNKRQEEPIVVFPDNNRYGEAKMDRNVGKTSTENKNKRTVFNVPPTAPSDETPDNDNTSKTSVARTEVIYNHLNEKEERDGEDNYDHACAATGLSRGGYFDSDYSSMRDMDKGSGKYAKNGEDNYFTLEQN